MRLSIVESGHRGAVAAVFRLMKRVVGFQPDVLRIMMYRPRFVGLRFGALNRSALAESTSWSRSEMELFGALVSSFNHCSFWVDAHAAVAVYGIAQSTVDAVLADWRAAPVSPRSRAIFEVLEILTLRPSELTAEAFAPASALGLDALAIVEALRACFIFSIVNRTVDAFDGRHPSKELQARASLMLHVLGFPLLRRLVHGQPADGTPGRAREASTNLETDGFAERARSALEHVCSVPAVTSVGLRTRVSAKILGECGLGPTVVMDDPVLEEYLQKVARNAYKVVDEDIAALRQGGLSEDAIWELTVVAALAAGTHRYFHAIHQLQPRHPT